MNTFYIKLDAQNIVKDVLSYPHDNYIKITATELPEGSYAGYYKYINNQFILDDVLFYEYLESIENEEYKVRLLNKLILNLKNTSN